jgi:uncharacterized protein involved in outer membrane biogenesis
MKLLKIALAVFAVLILLAVVGVFALNHYLASDAFKEVVLKEASAVAGAPVDAKGFKFSLFSGVLLEDVSVGSGGKGFKGKEFFHGARIELRYNLGALLQKKIQVTKVVFARPVLSIQQDAKGNTNIPAGGASKEPAPASSGEKETLPLDLNIDNLSIDDGAVSVRRADGLESCRIEGFNLGAAIQLAGADLGLKGDLKIKTVQVGALPLENLQSPFQTKKTNLDLTDITARAFGGKLKGTGGLDYAAADLPFRLNLKGSGLQLTELASKLAGTKSPLSGDMELNTELIAPLTAPLDVRGKGHVDIKNVSLGKNPVLELLGQVLQIPELGGGKFDLASANYAIEKQVVTLSKMVLTAPLIEMKGWGTVTFDQNYDLTLVLKLQPKAAAAMPKELRESFVANQDGSLSTPKFRVYGPSGDLKQTLLEELLKKRAGAEIEKQTDGLMNKLFQ